MEETRVTQCRYWELPNEQRLALAELIKRDNLPEVNKNTVVVAIPETFYMRYGKRCLDVIISFFAMIVTAPINFIIMIGTFFDVGTPIFFHQKRIGKDSKIFKLTKFRNMTNECNEDGILLPPEERITKWGHIMRKTSLDELLNFWNILKGDMSVIGPRPMPDEYLGRFSDRHEQRHLVRPGLECPPHDTSVAEMNWDNRFENDIWYVQNISFKTDIKMFILLVKDAIWGGRKEYRADAKIGCFMGYDKDGSIITSEDIPEKYYHELQEELLS